MTQKPKYQDMIGRLTAGECGREIESELYVRLNNWVLTPVPADADGQNACEIYTPNGKLFGPGFKYPPKGAIGAYYHVPNFKVTSDLTSAYQFVRHSIAAVWDIECIFAWQKTTCTIAKGSPFEVSFESLSPPLALVVAYLTALENANA